MKLLLDTHLLLWAAADRLPPSARVLIADPANALLFSAASLWEIAIKGSFGRPDFLADASVIGRGLVDNGYEHLPVTAAHGAAVMRLPAVHRDPFDRLLVAQAMVEGITLLTADARLGAYPGPVRVV